ncbi:hypothetical protein OAR97_00220 [Arcobacteraceae bacterium]|nr:hypothetical protein [Arcobacteraceae bacterium]
MIRFFLITVLLFTVSNASVIHFEEEKYVEVIDNSLYKKGTLEFIKNKIKLKYNNSSRILIYEDDTLTILVDNEIQKIDLKNQLSIKIVFLLIDSIYKNKYGVIKEYFTIDKEKNVNYLTPNKNLKNYILSVEFKKNKALDYIIIKMKNGNITTIREINE